MYHIRWFRRKRIRTDWVLILVFTYILTKKPIVGKHIYAVGGVGSVLGTLVGALIIGVLNNGLDILGVSAYYQQIAKGLIIIITVLMDRKSTN